MRRLARWCFTYRRVVLVGWLAVLACALVVTFAVSSNFNASLNLNGAESTKATALLQRDAPDASGSSNQIVIAARSGKVTDPKVRRRVEAMLARVRSASHVGSVSSPYAPGAANQISRDASVEFATVTFNQDADKLPLEDVKRVVSIARSAAGPSVNVQLGGEAITRTNSGGTGGLPLGSGPRSSCC